MVAAAAIAAAGDAIDWWDVPVLGVVVASVIVVAAGLAISTVVNRAWFLVPFVLLLSAAATFLVVAEPSLDGGVGERTNRPSTVADAERAHDLAMGELTLDLVDVPLDADRPVRVDAEVGVGRLHVIVPAGATLVVTSEVGTGHLVIGDREVVAGVRQDDRRTIAAIGESTGTIELDLRVGIGEIDLDRDVFALQIDGRGRLARVPRRRRGVIGMDLFVSAGSAGPAPLVAALLGVLALAAMWEPRLPGSVRTGRAGSEQHAADK